MNRCLMLRASYFLALALIVTLATSAAAKPLVGVPPIPRRLDAAEVAEMSKLLLEAQEAKVLHEVRATRPVPFATRVPCRIEYRVARFEQSIGGERVAELVKLLEIERLSEAAREPAPVPCAKDSAMEHRALLTFLAGDDSILADVSLRGGWCGFHWKREQGPRVHLGERTERLVAMLAGWMAEDSLLASVRPCRRDSTEASDPKPAGSAADSTEGYDEAPRLTMEKRPEYPPSAIRSGTEGIVRCRALIGKDGRLREIVIMESDPIFDAAAVQAVEQSKYTAAREDGRPTQAWLVLPFRFELLPKRPRR